MPALERGKVKVERENAFGASEKSMYVFVSVFRSREREREREREESSGF
jgi:hypothetical protein